MCTIRSNPSTPIHCIVWAKMLFARLFGAADEDNAVTSLDAEEDSGDHTTPPSDAHPNAAADAPTAGHSHEETLQRQLDDDRLQLEQQRQRGYPYFVFHKVFHTDILHLASMKHLWKTKKAPTPLTFDAVTRPSANTNTNTNTDTNTYLIEDQRVWSLSECAHKFIDSMTHLLARKRTEGIQTWDKDDDDHLDFVTAAANLRAFIFNIPTQSRFNVKADAGNIIPAIATTNAVIAGLIVLEAYKIIAGQMDRCKNTYFMRYPSRKRLFITMRPETPNPNCYVCGNQFVVVRMHTHRVTFNTFLRDVLIARLGFKEPTVIVDNDIVYEGGEEACRFEVQLAKTCSSLRITSRVSRRWSCRPTSRAFRRSHRPSCW